MNLFNFASANTNLLFFFPQCLHFMWVIPSANMNAQSHFCEVLEYVMSCSFLVKMNNLRLHTLSSKQNQVSILHSHKEAKQMYESSA
jgi:hypothetical protein